MIRCPQCGHCYEPTARTLARSLGARNAGKRRTLSPEDRARRADRMRAINAARKERAA